MFKLYSMVGTERFLLKQLPITSAETVAEGMIVSVSNGRLTKGVTNTDLAGLHVIGARTGNAGGTVLGQIAPLDHYLIEADRNGLATSAVQEGDKVDLAADGLSIAANVNGDFVVVKYDAVRDKVILRALNTQKIV